MIKMRPKKNSFQDSGGIVTKILFIFWAGIAFVLASGCQKESASSTDGVGHAALRLPSPKSLSPEDLSRIRGTILEQSLDGTLKSRSVRGSLHPKSVLSRSLIRAIIDTKGIPRPQIRQILEDIFSPEETLCAGVRCSQIFGLKPEDIDRYLDDLARTVEKSKVLREADYAESYHTIVSSLKKSEQAAWQRPTVDGISYLPNGEIDRTEGVGAFMDLPLKKDTRNLDVGGGAHESNTQYLATRGVTNYVYDPYARSEAHNQKILDLVARSPVDTVTSMSILNVIDQVEARLAHIRLCQKSLKKGGRAIFKVWSGNGSGQGEYILGGYQSHRGAKSYLSEVQQIFGKEHVTYDAQLDVLMAVRAF